MVKAEDFLKTFSENFDQSSSVIDLSTSFRDLEEWSSMQALIVIASIDEHFGITIPEREFREAKTVLDLFNLTISK